MSKLPERFAIACELIDPREEDQILEIGCGTGVLVEELAKVTVEGHILGLDASKSAIVHSNKRNQVAIHAKRVAFVHSKLEDVVLPNEKFDKVISFNVGLFLQNSSRELSHIRASMKEDAKIFVFYQFPFEVDLAAADKIKEVLQSNHFKIEEKGLRKTATTSVVYVIATKE